MQFNGCHQPVQRSHWSENAKLTGWHNGNEMRNAICVENIFVKFGHIS